MDILSAMSVKGVDFMERLYVDTGLVGRTPFILFQVPTFFLRDVDKNDDME
jgi:hypothetical protein